MDEHRPRRLGQFFSKLVHLLGPWVRAGDRDMQVVQARLRVGSPSASGKRDWFCSPAVRRLTTVLNPSWARRPSSALVGWPVSTLRSSLSLILRAMRSSVW